MARFRYLNTIPKGCGGGTRFYSDEQKGKLVFDPEQRRYVAPPQKNFCHSMLCFFLLCCAVDSRAHALLCFARYVGQAEHELGTIDPVCGRVAMFFHNHMHEGVPPVHGAYWHCGATILG